MDTEIKKVIINAEKFFIEVSSNTDMIKKITVLTIENDTVILDLDYYRYTKFEFKAKTDQNCVRYCSQFIAEGHRDESSYTVIYVVNLSNPDNFMHNAAEFSKIIINEN